MRNIQDVRKNPSSQIRWGIYNFGILIYIAHRRKDAKKLAEELTGKPWDKIKGYVEIHKVLVSKVRSNHEN